MAWWLALAVNQYSLSRRGGYHRREAFISQCLPHHFPFLLSQQVAIFHRDMLGHRTMVLITQTTSNGHEKTNSLLFQAMGTWGCLPLSNLAYSDEYSLCFLYCVHEISHLVTLQRCWPFTWN